MIIKFGEKTREFKVLSFLFEFVVGVGFSYSSDDTTLKCQIKPSISLRYFYIYLIEFPLLD